MATIPLEDAAGYRAIIGNLAAEGREVRVYVDADVPRDQLAPDLVATIIHMLDDRLIPRSREILGDWADIDADGKLAVLVTPWLGRLRGGQTAIDGCVRANDFQRRVEAPFGNAADVLYLNSQLAPGPRLETVLAHEYTHIICFSQRLGNMHGPMAMEEDWLNEALAHVAENLFETGWSNLEERIARYLGASAQSPLTVVDYYRSGLWRDPGCRGAAYLFLRYCVDQFGPDLLRDLIQNPLTGPRNLERATGTPFATLFRHWTIALARGHAVPRVTSTQEGPHCAGEPLRVAWPLDKGRQTLELQGTSASFINVQNIHATGQRIRISGTPEARLQVTLIRLPKTIVATKDSCLTSP